MHFSVTLHFSGRPHTINRGRGIPYSAPSFLWESPYHQHKERHTLLYPIISLGDPIPSTGGEAYLILPHNFSGRPPYHQQEGRHTLLWETSIPSTGGEAYGTLGDPIPSTRGETYSFSGRLPYHQQEGYCMSTTFKKASPIPVILLYLPIVIL